MRVYLNGQYLPLEQARISPLDRGFLFGDGVYEVIPVFNQQVFLLKEHLERLDRSLNAIDMKNPLTHDEWTKIINQISEQSQAEHFGVYLQVTRGAAATRQHTYSDDLTPTVFVMLIQPKTTSAEDKARGVAAITLPDERWAHCDIKSINLLPNILAIQQGVKQGAYETIFIRNGWVTEGSGSNIFMVKDNTIVTPPKSHQILPGITRQFILDLALQHQLPYEERNISEQELLTADEIWMTSSTRDVLAITKLNGNHVGNGQVGPLWNKINQYFQAVK